MCVPRFHHLFTQPALALFVLILSNGSWAAGGGADVRASFKPGGPAAAHEEAYFFAAPPRESAGQGENVYEPIAEFLTQATGKRFDYVYPENWIKYTTEMRKGKYDLVFDGPHFVGWRTLRLNHTPILKIGQPHVWVVIARADNDKVKAIRDLVGRKVCAHAPPNFGTLTLQSLFDNPARQPTINEIKGWDSAFRGVMNGDCAGTILPMANYKKLDPEQKQARIIYQHKPYPNQALTAGPRISPELRERIVAALNTPAGKQATKALRDKFAKGEDLVAPKKNEYNEVALVLKNYWGFEF